MAGRRGVLAFGFLDQGIVSAGSLLLLIAAAQGLSPDDLGRFALGTATAAIFMSVSRALVGETLVARVVGRARPEPSAVLGLAVSIALASSSILFVLGVVAPGMREVFWGSALVCLGTLVHDSLRYVLIDERLAGRLLLLDCVTVAGQTLFVYWSVTSFGSVVCALGAWALMPVLASLIFVLASEYSVAVGPGWCWLKSEFRRSSAYAAETVLGAVVGYCTILVVGWVAGSAAIAVMRTLISVYGITSIAINFVRSSYMRHLGSGNRVSRGGVRVVYLRLGAGFLMVVIAATAALSLIPASLGVGLFGDTWVAVSGLLVFGAINRFAASLSVIPTVVLRVAGVAWEATRIRVLIGAASIFLGPVGAFYGGVAGALLAEAFSYLLILFGLSWVVLRRLPSD